MLLSVNRIDRAIASKRPMMAFYMEVVLWYKKRILGEHKFHWKLKIEYSRRLLRTLERLMFFVRKLIKKKIEKLWKTLKSAIKHRAEIERLFVFGFHNNCNREKYQWKLYHGTHKKQSIFFHDRPERELFRKHCWIIIDTLI